MIFSKLPPPPPEILGGQADETRNDTRGDNDDLASDGADHNLAGVDRPYSLRRYGRGGHPSYRDDFGRSDHPSNFGL